MRSGLKIVKFADAAVPGAGADYKPAFLGARKRKLQIVRHTIKTIQNIGLWTAAAENDPISMPTCLPGDRGLSQEGA